MDYSNEAVVAALVGGAIGGAAVVGATAVAVAAGAATSLGIVFLPMLVAGVLIGGGTNKRKTAAREQELRAIV